MSSRDLEKEFNAALWSQRSSDPKELIQKHVEYGNTVSDSNRYSLNCLLNTPYGDSFRQKLDIYGVNLPFDAPIVVYVHGGFWQKSNKHTASYAVKPFVEQHAKVIVIDFDLCPDVPLADIIKQVQKAAERVFSYAGEHKPKSISFIGHDSGAHLITYLLSEEMVARIGDNFKLLRNVYLISGVFDVSELRHTQVLNRGNLLSISDENVDQLSPLKQNFSHLSKFNVTVDAFVGGDESPILQKQSRKFIAHLKMEKLHANYHLMDGLDHYDIVEKISENSYEITEKIINDLKS